VPIRKNAPVINSAIAPVTATVSGLGDHEMPGSDTVPPSGVATGDVLGNARSSGLICGGATRGSARSSGLIAGGATRGSARSSGDTPGSGAATGVVRGSARSSGLIAGGATRANARSSAETPSPGAATPLRAEARSSGLVDCTTGVAVP
jgi:hypothetical protein